MEKAFGFDGSLEPVRHVLLTRYNIGLFSDNPYRIKDPVKWMRRRFELFGRYTWPSVVAQTSKEFDWLLIFDPDTPPELIEPVSAAVRFQEMGHGWRIRFVSSQSLALTDWVGNVDWNCDTLLTTRLDNDDAIDPEFMETVRRHALKRLRPPKATSGLPRILVDTRGRFFDIVTHERTPTKRRYANSPFLTLGETQQPFKTVCSQPHSTFHQTVPSVYEQQPMHTITIHENNQQNQV